LNALIVAFTVPSASNNGIGANITGSLTQPQNLGGFAFTGESAFNLTSSLTENISATSILGLPGALTGTLTLNWSGNASAQTRAATGTITLNGDLVGTPEPSTALLLSLPFAGLLVSRKLRRSFNKK
jgi:hypothetical protein